MVPFQTLVQLTVIGMAHRAAVRQVLKHQSLRETVRLL